tara:strand:+ start:869 stop:1018 length:150 start_codon:yes stop_codon:yes gene_type:complete
MLDRILMGLLFAFIITIGLSALTVQHKKIQELDKDLVFILDSIKNNRTE